MWLPLEAGLAHYRACDQLGFSALEQVQIGRAVGERVHGTFLATMIRTAKNAGVTPWTADPMAGTAYFRNGMRGLYQVGVELFCRKAYVNELPLPPGAPRESSLVLKISWA